LRDSAWQGLGGGLGGGFVTSLAAGADGSVLAGVQLDGAYRLDAGAWKRLTLPLHDNPSYLVGLGDGGAVVGTARGLYGTL
ncbi:MAG TPA: hypothetical protein VNT60_00850, partial [Deinococcales bacterium]|nr:hypothetical protein [Deinococcales bacterium]